MWAAAFVVLFVLDQLSKAWVREHVPLGHVTVLVPGAFDLTYAPNRGIAFSALASLPDIVRVPLLLAVPLGFTLLVGAYAVRRWKELHLSARAAFVLIVAGALGNLMDRVRLGAVTDFVVFRIGERTLFVNNFADDYISVGAGLLALVTMVGWLGVRGPSDTST